MKAAYLVLVLAGGCAETYSVNGHPVDPDEYAEATAERPAGTTRRSPPTCRVTAADTNYATVDCRYTGSPTPKDWRIGMRAELRLAAQTSVIAGKTAIALVGREAPDVRTANYTSPVACTRAVNGLRAVGVFLGGMGGAYQDHAHCSTSGRDTDCTFVPAQRVPDIHDTTCVGGTTTTYISQVTTESRWRLLTDTEAEAPEMALLADANKPIACTILLSSAPPKTNSQGPQEGTSALSGSAVAGTSHKAATWQDPFADVPSPPASSKQQPPPLPPDHGSATQGPRPHWVPSQLLDQSVALNPKYSVSINPKYNVALNPKYSVSINPKYNVSINPEYTVSINPKYSTQLNPKYNPQLDPRINADLTYDLPKRIRFFLFSVEGELLGLLAFGSDECLLFMDADGDWKGTAISDGNDGYNLFRNNGDWWAYLRPTGEGGLNMFEKSEAEWIGYGVSAKSSESPKD
jgi:hypothetical protein